MAQHVTSAKVRVLTNNSKRMKDAVREGMKTGLRDVIKDLIEVSSDSAPKDTGKLESSYKKRVIVGMNKAMGIVGYTAINEDNNFEYSIRMHEDHYNLGPISAMKKGGTSKISGKSFPVGRKFLEYPLKESEDAYVDHIRQTIYSKTYNVK